MPQEIYHGQQPDAEKHYIYLYMVFWYVLIVFSDFDVFRCFVSKLSEICFVNPKWWAQWWKMWKIMEDRNNNDHIVSRLRIVRAPKSPRNAEKTPPKPRAPPTEPRTLRPRWKKSGKGFLLIWKWLEKVWAVGSQDVFTDITFKIFPKIQIYFGSYQTILLWVAVVWSHTQRKLM